MIPVARDGLTVPAICGGSLPPRDTANCSSDHYGYGRRKTEHRRDHTDHAMIVFPRAVFDDLIDHAEAGAPEEVCGVLGGEHGEDVSRVSVAERAANAATIPEYEYRIDPEEQYELMGTIEDEGHETAGFYHSHPAGPPNPSETDAARATWPGLSYVIVVLDGRHPFVGSWRWNGDEERFEQEAVRLER